MKRILQDIKVFGGRLVKPFDNLSTDRYIQCVADIGKPSLQVALYFDSNISVSVDGVSVRSGEKIDVLLKEKGYGYVIKTVQAHEKTFYLAFLKPAPSQEILYGLERRPRFHYTAPYGYINDPNGMIYDATQKKYHLFYQAYPYEAIAMPKHWGHAVTSDLVTFEEYPTALYPDGNGDMWSGTAIVDYENTARLYGENVPPASRILLIYYARKGPEKNAGLAYTPDGGKTWIKADNGRLVNFIGKKPDHVDPKVLWSDKLKKWIMFCASGEVYTSNDLWNWTYNSSDQSAECPDIYQIKVEETGEKKYVRTYGWGYCVGDIAEKDSTVQFQPYFQPKPLNGNCLIPSKHKELLQKYGWHSGKVGSYYAVQHYAKAPDERIVSAAWLLECGLDETGTWAGATSVATEHKLHKKNSGEYLLYSYPVQELQSLRGNLLYSASGTVLSPNGDNLLKEVSALYADMESEFLLDENVTELGFRLRTGKDGGFIAVKYDAVNELLVTDFSNSKHGDYDGIRTMKMKKASDGRIALKILLDSIIVECFGNFGEASISSVFCRNNDCCGIELFVVGGTAAVEKLEIYQMKSAWYKE